MSRFTKIAVVVFAVAFSGVSFAKSARTLIVIKDGETSAGLASSWKKVEEGKFEFVLDPKAKLKKGVSVTPQMVKTSLEKKLGNSFGVTVTAEGTSKVVVTYTGAEAQFLAKVGRTRIRPGGGTEIAMESSASDAGMRANSKMPNVKDGEIKVTLTKVKKSTLRGLVVETKNSNVKAGKIVLAPVQDKKWVKGGTLIFTPGAKSDSKWPIDDSKEVYYKAP